jgi:hypothetical protein
MTLWDITEFIVCTVSGSRMVTEGKGSQVDGGTRVSDVVGFALQILDEMPK